MKGIVLAGGTGTRLHPMTYVISKQLLPVYDKPMIYYPISTLMLAGIRDILIITTPEDQYNFQKLLGDGSEWGINLNYQVQNKPEGIAQAFIIGNEFVGNDKVALVLGDNLFYGRGFSQMLRNAAHNKSGAFIFGYYVKDPERYGIVEINKLGEILTIEEKPQEPKSNYAITGLYFYDNQVLNIARTLTPSTRGELEITAINQAYLNSKQLKLEILGRGYAWLDTGTPESLHDAASFVNIVQSRQGLMIACPEEIAFQAKWIDIEHIQKRAASLKNSAYSNYLSRLVQDAYAKA